MTERPDDQGLPEQVDDLALRLEASEYQAGVDRDILATLQIDEELARNHADQLEQALRTSRIIGAAVGMVMASRQLDQDDALAVLKDASSRTNVKLSVLCAEMVQNGNSTQAPS